MTSDHRNESQLDQVGELVTWSELDRSPNGERLKKPQSWTWMSVILTKTGLGIEQVMDGFSMPTPPKSTCTGSCGACVLNIRERSWPWFAWSFLKLTSNNECILPSKLEDLILEAI